MQRVEVGGGAKGRAYGTNKGLSKVKLKQGFHRPWPLRLSSPARPLPQELQSGEGADQFLGLDFPSCV